MNDSKLRLKVTLTLPFCLGMLLNVSTVFCFVFFVFFFTRGRGM